MLTYLFEKRSHAAIERKLGHGGAAVVQSMVKCRPAVLFHRLKGRRRDREKKLGHGGVADI